MSIVAEFADIIQNKSINYNRELNPVFFPSETDKLYNIEAVIFDIYGTLINYYRTEFKEKETKVFAMLDAFDKTADFFDMYKSLEKINPGTEPKKTLYDFYNGLIMMEHEKKREKGIDYPEIKIEEIWALIIMILKRNGYDFSVFDLGEISDFSKCVAYYYNFCLHNRALFPNVFTALNNLKKNNIRLGILSNAQFYTPIDLTLFLRKQSNNEIIDYLELFDADLIFYSYEYGIAKPSNFLYEKLFNSLYELNILPENTLFVGNDLIMDIASAKSVGLKTALWAGDSLSVFNADNEHIIPDIVFTDYNQLPEKISYYKKPGT